MNNQFKTQLLKSIATKKKNNEGFTLIELLVVVIIIGVLAAIALPSLLGQVGKARESEAKTFTGSINKAQQAYYTEKAGFVTAASTSAADAKTALALLETTAQLKYYKTPDLSNTGLVLLAGKDNKGQGTKDYAGGIAWNSADRLFTTIIVRGNVNPDYTLDNTAVSKFGVQPTAGDAVTLGSNSEEVK